MHLRPHTLFCEPQAIKQGSRDSFFATHSHHGVPTLMPRFMCQLLKWLLVSQGHSPLMSGSGMSHVFTYSSDEAPVLFLSWVHPLLRALASSQLFTLWFQFFKSKWHGESQCGPKSPSLKPNLLHQDCGKRLIQEWYIDWFKIDILITPVLDIVSSNQSEEEHSPLFSYLLQQDTNQCTKVHQYWSPCI